MNRLAKFCMLLAALAGGAFICRDSLVADGEGVTSMPQAPVLKEPFAGNVIGDIDREQFPEPSGIVFHPMRKTLFVVGDGGDLCEMTVDGTRLRTKHFLSESTRLDFEGITVHPLSGMLYIAVEGAEAILEVDPASLDIKRRFDLARELNGKMVMTPGIQGIEGITFIADPKHPQGGTFLVANQAFDLEGKEDVSAIFEVEVPLNGSSPRVSGCRLLRGFSLGVTDLSDLAYDSDSGLLLVLSDINDLLILATPDGRVAARYENLPCENQEGIALDESGYIYIAQDSGGIVKIRYPVDGTLKAISHTFPPSPTD